MKFKVGDLVELLPSRRAIRTQDRMQGIALVTGFDGDGDPELFFLRSRWSSFDYAHEYRVVRKKVQSG